MVVSHGSYRCGRWVSDRLPPAATFRHHQLLWKVAFYVLFYVLRCVNALLLYFIESVCGDFMNWKQK